ncbi:alpha/beta hydrolase [Streptomyces corynorhini]|uniref:alpha/beta hydrolase n=1 Tax=Streptomyces corynorhini TaxID=2282652 RepID=UPI001314EB7E|nr:alpha/beta hydrolase [Streptomyces corynorhini]
MSTLDPQAQALIDAAIASGLPPVHSLPAAQARRRMRSAFIWGDPEPIEHRKDLIAPGPAGDLPVRLYHPAPGRRLPLIVFFHGGGWIVNDLDTHDRLCARLAVESSCAVLSVDFRCAPEHPYPAPVEDGYAALVWAASHGDVLGVDTSRVAVAGDSSGGTVATAVCMTARDRGGPVIGQQTLIYPVTDHLDPPTASYRERGTGYSLNRGFMEWAWQAYLPAEWSATDPRLFPLRAADLRGLPRTLMLTAEFDPLRDEGIAYADRLSEAGVPTEHWHFDDQMHGFALQTHAIDRARRAVADTARHIAAVLRESPEETL